MSTKAVKDTLRTSPTAARLFAALAGIDPRSLQKWATNQRVTARMAATIERAVDELRALPRRTGGPLGELARTLATVDASNGDSTPPPPSRKRTDKAA